MPKITKRSVDAAKPQKTGDLYVWDSGEAGCVPGFGIRVKPSGAKSFLVQYRNRNGRSRRLTLGRYGILTPEHARTLAKQTLADVTRGNDPADLRAKDREAKTIAELCADYLARAEAGTLLTRRQKPKKASTLATDRGRVERHIVPLLGNRTVKDLTAADVRAFLRDVTAGKTAADVKTKARGRAIVKGGAGAGTRTLGLLGGILTFAIEEGYRTDNPVTGIRRPKDGKRAVRLDADGYRTLGERIAAAEQNGARWQVTTMSRVIALTGCRRGEIEKLRRTEVDVARRTLRLGDTKTGESIRPIGTAAVVLLQEAMRRAGNNEFVFPATSGDGSFKGLPRAWTKMVRPVLPKLTPHGLRHAFASIADDLDFSKPTIKAMLGHARADDVTAGYIHKLDAALIAAADRVSQWIADAMAGGTDAGNVVRMEARA